MPFCDHHLVDYLFNVPWLMKSFDGREKSLLRAVARNILPAEVVQRRKSPYPVAAVGAFDDLLRARLQCLSAALEALLFTLFDHGKVSALAAAPVDPSRRFVMERLIHIENWLRNYRPAILVG